MPLDFDNNPTVDALVDSGAYVSAITQNDLDTKKNQKAPNNILKIDDPPNFQIQVAKCQLEKPLATATLKFGTGDKICAEQFVVMKKLTGPIVGLHFMRNNSVVIDTTHELIHFPHLTMQVKTASSEKTTTPQPVITDDALTIPPKKTETITVFVDHPSKWSTTGTVTPLEKFTVTESLLSSHSMSTINDKKIAVRVTKTMESPYLTKKNTQIAEFSVVTPEQSKQIKPVDMAILSMIPQGDQQRLPKSWTFTDWICQIESFDSYKSNNDFPFTFYYFGAIIHSLSFLDAVARCGWFHSGRWSFQMLRVYWRRK